MRYSPLKGFILDGLVGGPWEGVFIGPGPDDRQTPPGRFVLATMVGGPGLNTDDLFDGTSYQIMVAGEQNDYDDAEGLAFAIDAIFVNAHSQHVGGKWMTTITRQGGPPAPLNVDDADRWRFTASYIFDVRSAVV